jgi:hypothetical protein
MPAERVAMRPVREIIRLKFSAGISTREIARRLGIAASTVRETLRRFEGAGLGWPLPDGMSDGLPRRHQASPFQSLGPGFQAHGHLREIHPLSGSATPAPRLRTGFSLGPGASRIGDAA